MTNSRRITLLSSFALIGVGLAMCVGFSTTTKPDSRKVAVVAPTDNKLAAEPSPVEPPDAIESEAAEPPEPVSEAASAGHPEPTTESEPPEQPEPIAESEVTEQPEPIAAPEAAEQPEPTPESSLAEAPAIGSDPAEPPASKPVVATSELPPLLMPEFSPAALPYQSPVVVEPYPALAQQPVSPLLDQLEAATEHVRRRLGPLPPGLEPVAAPPAAATPPAPTTPAPPAPTTPLPRTEVSIVSNGFTAEGDDALEIHFNNEDLRTVLEALADQARLNILASANVQGSVTASLSGVDVDSALDAILKSTGYVAKREGKFIYVGTPQDFDQLEQTLDRVGTRVYRPNYVTAAELQALITPILTDKVGVASISSASEQGIGADDAVAGGDTFAGAEVVLVRDYEAVLTQIDQLVGQVDIRPLQVQIEAMILSVHLNDEDRYGVSFELLREEPHLRFGWGTPYQDLSKMEFEKGALKLAFLDSSLSSFLDALEKTGDTNVIATPRVMALNKQRADIQIGAQKGYVSTTVTETTSTQSVEFLETGTILRLRPFISPDGLIRMELHPELSKGDVEVKGNFTLPFKETTEVTTNVMVRDGCTVVIGGLMREELADTRNQIPLLGNLPWVGPAFRSSNQKTERFEILVLITPHIVYEPGTCTEGNTAACEFFRRQDLFADKMEIFNKRAIGRRYFRLAQGAWAAGNQRMAYRFIELAVHFDPLNRAAIDLRADIWSGNPAGDHTLPPAPEVSSEMLDGDALPPWLLNNLEGETAAFPHPRDPGRPGAKSDLLRPRRLQ